MQTAQSRWNARNRESCNSAGLRWRQRNRKAEVERNMEYKRTHRSEVCQRQLARQRKTGVISQDTLGEVFAYYGDNCVYCGETANGVDHLHPVTKEGSSDVQNLAPCCRRCNSRKYNLPIWVMV